MRKELSWLIAFCFVVALTTDVFTSQATAAAKPDGDCWCCVDGKVAKVSPRACKKRGGECFKSEKTAKKECREKVCFCCIDGNVVKISPKKCKQRGGQCYNNKRQARKECRDSQCWCCLKGKIGKTSARDCKKRGGQCFKSKAQARKECREKVCFCCIDGNVIKTSPKKCKQRGGQCYNNKRQARKECRDSQCWCCVDGEVAKVSPRDCKKRRGQCYKSQKAAKKGCQKKAATKGPPKVRAFLESFEKAKSPLEAFVEHDLNQFSKSELRILQERLKAPKYRSKLEPFNRAAREVYAHKTAKDPSKKVGDRVRELNNKLQEEHKEKVGKINSNVAQMAVALRNRLETEQRLPLFQAAPAMMVELMSETYQFGGAEARITGPESVTVGDTTRILGTGFGNRTGKVFLLFGDNRNIVSRVELPVKFWRDESITVEIPGDLQPTFHCNPSGAPTYSYPGERERSMNEETPVVLWVHLEGAESGPSKELLIRHDNIRPRITSVTPETLTPGCELVVEGRNFMETDNPNESSGSMYISWGPHRLEFELLEWRDKYIRALIPEDTSGLPKTDNATIFIRNCQNFTTQLALIKFEPNYEYIAKEKEEWVRCQPPPPVAFACFFPNRVEKTYWDHTLLNGWTVYGVYTDTDTHTCFIDIIEGIFEPLFGSGANSDSYWGDYYDVRYLRRPQRGDTNTLTRVDLQVNAGCAVKHTFTLLIKGPSGTDPGTID